jgi:hypothetical protein
VTAPNPSGVKMSAPIVCIGAPGCGRSRDYRNAGSATETMAIVATTDEVLRRNVRQENDLARCSGQVDPGHIPA